MAVAVVFIYVWCLSESNCKSLQLTLDGHLDGDLGNLAHQKMSRLLGAIID